MSIRFIAILALVLSSTLVVAGPDSDAVGEFGLFGTWATDCSKPRSDENFYQVFTPSDQGYPVCNDPFVSGNVYMSELRQVKIIAPDRLSYLDVRSSGRDETNIVLEKVGNRWHSVKSVDRAGKVWVEDGKFVETGKPTPFFEKCSE